MTTPIPHVGAAQSIPFTDAVPMLRRLASFACDDLRRRPDWSPMRDIDVCVCGATLGAHAAKLLVQLIDDGVIVPI